VPPYLGVAGAHALLAELNGETIGLLACSVRPGLFHAYLMGCIEELIVTTPARRLGVAEALMRTTLERLQGQGCKGVAPSTELQNAAAQRPYRKLGLMQESLLLQRHLQPNV
jgi:ribosomal protein S18 acetylase RimI-like enzyme